MRYNSVEEELSYDDDFDQSYEDVSELYCCTSVDENMELESQPVNFEESTECSIIGDSSFANNLSNSLPDDNVSGKTLIVEQDPKDFNTR